MDLNNGVYAAELWNPATGTWRTLAAEQATRQYHSTALLLPDGRVLSAGGGICGNATRSATSPRTRRSLVRRICTSRTVGRARAAPGDRRRARHHLHATNFQIDTPDAASIRKVALVRLGAVTHSVNMEQRYVPLSFTAGTGALTATAPANADIAPPGVYMLFIIDANGVPSIAKMVTVAPPDTTPPTAPTGLSATAAGATQANLSWTASSDNVGITEYRVERCAGAGCTNFAQVGTPTGTSFSDAGLAPSTDYRYRVRAADAATNLSPYSAIATATTAARHDAADGADRAERDGGRRHPGQPQLDGLERQRRRDGIPSGALRGSGLHELRPGRDPDRHLVQRRRPRPVDRLPLSGARRRRRHQPEPLLGDRHRDHSGLDSRRRLSGSDPRGLACGLLATGGAVRD